jgi:hypothetical protein
VAGQPIFGMWVKLASATTLMCNLDCSLAAAALVMASTFAFHLSRILETRLRRNERRERSINA